MSTLPVLFFNTKPYLRPKGVLVLEGHASVPLLPSPVLFLKILLNKGTNS